MKKSLIAAASAVIVSCPLAFSAAAARRRKTDKRHRHHPRIHLPTGLHPDLIHRLNRVPLRTRRYLPNGRPIWSRHGSLRFREKRKLEGCTFEEQSGHPTRCGSSMPPMTCFT